MQNVTVFAYPQPEHMAANRAESLSMNGCTIRREVWRFEMCEPRSHRNACPLVYQSFTKH